MRVQRRQHEGSIAFDLLDDLDRPIAEAGGFLRHLGARACSPNTLCAYAHDLLHFYQFLELAGLNADRFGPPESLALLEHLRRVPSRRPTGRLDLVLATTIASGASATRLAPATVNRIFAARSGASACVGPGSAVHGVGQPPASGAASRQGQDRPAPSPPAR